jgi:hypothetical protein
MNNNNYSIYNTHGVGKTPFIKDMLEFIECNKIYKNNKSRNLICRDIYNLNYICIKLINLIYFNLCYIKYIKVKMNSCNFCLACIKYNIKNNELFKEYKNDNILLNILLPDCIENSEENKLFKSNIIKKNKNTFYNCRIKNN